MKTVELSKLAEEMDLKNLTPEVDMSGVKVTTPEINRPALQLTGYLEHFEATRVQIIGYVGTFLSSASGSGSQRNCV